MKSRIFLFVGIILIGVGLIVFFSLNGAKMNVHGPGFQTVSAETEQLANVIIRYGVPGLLSGLGLIFLIAGFVGMGKAGNQNKMMKAALQYGTETEGTITFVDKNYTLLVNKNPIYSIVEYKYLDMNGTEHVRRIDNFNSEFVIRHNIQVGNKIKVKYLPNDPSQSVMLIQ